MHLLWSNCMREVKFFFGMLGQCSESVRQFVLLGLATTRILADGLATLFRISPLGIVHFVKDTCFLKISLFICSRSDLSMPGFRGNPPRKMPTSISLNAWLGSEWTLMEFTNSNAQSSSCIFIPSSSRSLSGSSRRFKESLILGPKTWPDPRSG